MGWISRYGKWQDDFSPPAPNPVRFKHIIAGLLFFSLFLGCVALFPLLLIFVPKPQLVAYTPPGIYCATCKEIWEHNRDLFNREEMLCYGPPTHERPTRKDEEVMYEEMRRCWTLEEGHDEWLRPLMVTEEETREMEGKAKMVVVRGGWRS